MTASPPDTCQGLLDSARRCFERGKGGLPGSGSGSLGGVSMAFSLGWEMSGLYLEKHPIGTSRRERVGGDRLPSLSGLAKTERSLVRLDQIRGIAIDFYESFGAAGVDPLPKTDDVKALIENEVAPVEIRISVDKLHRSLLGALSAVDPRLAKAYRLGVSLAATCGIPDDEKAFKEEFDRYRLANFGEWLADLASLFPPHASRAVRLSLSAWRRWIEDPKINPVEKASPLDREGGALRRIGHAARARAKRPAPLDWEIEGAEVVRVMSRQGEVWRAVLSGEKGGDAMLDLPDYMRAALKTLRRTTRLLWGVRIPIILALVVFGIGAVVLVNDGSTGKLLVGVAAVASAFGFTWKGTMGAIGRVASGLEHPVWGAELDAVIAEAITEWPRGAVFEWDEPNEVAPASGPPASLHQKGAEDLASGS